MKAAVVALALICLAATATVDAVDATRRGEPGVALNPQAAPRNSFPAQANNAAVKADAAAPAAAVVSSVLLPPGGKVVAKQKAKFAPINEKGSPAQFNGKTAASDALLKTWADLRARVKNEPFRYKVMMPADGDFYEYSIEVPRNVLAGPEYAKIKGKASQGKAGNLPTPAAPNGVPLAVPGANTAPAASLLEANAALQTGLQATDAEVYGKDHPWTQINKTMAATFPYRVIGSFGYFCSAALITNQIVATAAHCVWNASAKTWAGPWADLKFYPGVYDQTIPAAHKVQAMVMTQTYANHDQYYPEGDFALLVLEKPANIGHLGWKRASYSMSGTDVEITGYPQRKKPGYEMWMDRCVMADTLGTCSAPNWCDIEPGNSGGPVYDSAFDLIGVVSGEPAGSGKGKPTLYNYACQLEAEETQLIQTAIAALDAVRR